MSIMQTLFSGRTLNFTFIASATSQASTITIPSSAQEGDFAILFDRSESSFNIPLVVPSGFTLVQNNGGGFGLQLRGAVSYKILSSTDPNSSVTGMGGFISSRKIILIFRPNSVISNVVVESNGQVSSNSISNQTISMFGISTPIIGVSHYFADEAIFTRGDSSSSMTETSNSTLQYSKHIIYNLNSSPQNITVSINQAGFVRGLQSAYFTFT